ncbi:phosphate transporter [Colletotrichum tofieldiae]|nr:phosphate transporter [Colletotrichum tofieldiae]
MDGTKEADKKLRADLTTLKYVEPAPMGSSEEGKLVTTTIHAYDTTQLRQAFRSQAMGIAMMGFMHIYMNALESNLVKIHVFGQPASGDLKRPFKAPAGFMQGLQSGPAQSDKKAIETAERAGRGGAKEE